MNPIAIRLLSQQLVCPQFCSPEEVIRYMGAMQAQEYRMMRWAVAMRRAKPSSLIAEIVTNNTYGLNEIFTGMQKPNIISSEHLIATDD